MDAASFLTSYLWQLAAEIPIFLIALFGISWAALQWQKAPRPAFCVVIACLVIVFGNCVLPAVGLWYPLAILENAPRNRPDQDIFAWLFWANRAFAASWSLCNAVTIGTLVIAVFMGRVHPKSIPMATPVGKPENGSELGEGIQSKSEK
jgi:hypothetical protein